MFLYLRARTFIAVFHVLSKKWLHQTCGYSQPWFLQEWSDDVMAMNSIRTKLGELRDHYNSSSPTILTVFCSEISWQSLVLGIGTKWWRQNLPWSTSWFDLMITRRKEKVLYYNHCQFRGVLEECTYTLHRITWLFFCRTVKLLGNQGLPLSNPQVCYQAG